MAYLEMSRIEKYYDDFHALKGIDLEIAKEEFVVFVGPSGCGKTTLLRSIAGLETINEGRITIDGRDVTTVHPSKRGVAMVFQNYALFPHLSVFENIAFGLRLQRLTKDELTKRVRRTATLLHLEELLDRKPKQLSGGQRQRVAIGRAIVKQPKIFLFDEPLSNLDAKLRVRMRVELLNLHYETRNTAIYVTHDQVEAMTMADRIVILNAGKIEQVGTPLDLYERPANQFVAGFIGSPQMNFLPVTVQSQQDGMLRCLLPGVGNFSFGPLEAADSFAGRKLNLGIRPEHVILDSIPDALKVPAVVNIVENLGSETCVHSEIGEEQILVSKLDGSVRPERNHRLAFYFPADKMFLFDENGRAVHRTESPLPDKAPAKSEALAKSRSV